MYCVYNICFIGAFILAFPLLVVAHALEWKVSLLLQRAVGP